MRSKVLSFAEVELPGLLVNDSYAPPPPTPATNSPTASTDSPSDSPSMKMYTSPPISDSPTVIQTASPITSSGSLQVASVVDSSTNVTVFGCKSSYREWAVVDGTTHKFGCNPADSDLPGIIFTPTHNDQSIVEGIRLYGKFYDLPVACVSCYQFE